jgi:DNA-binding transcriptional MocR family regulator
MRDRATGNPDPALLPALDRALPAPHRLYGAPPVEPALAEVAGRALARDGIAGRLCAVSGALDGIERVLAAGIAAGDAVAVEDPGWPGVLDLVRALGGRLVPVAVDERGMRPAALADALRLGARAVVLTPRGQNPTGAAFDAARAAELADVLAGAPDVLVVEDDHLGPVAGVPWRSLAPGRERWAVVRSVSKWLGPDLRLAILAADELTLARVEGRQSLGPGWVSGLLQRLAAALWADPQVEALVERATRVYTQRRAALVTALAAQGIAVRAPSGLNVWVPVPDEDAAVRALLADGVSVAAGAPYRLNAGPAVRITTAALEPGEPEALAAALAAAISPPRRTRAA